jgi:hypothetical protein
MKKITKDGIIHTIKIEPIMTAWVYSDLSIVPGQYKFTVEILCRHGKPSIGGKDVQDWFYLIFDKFLAHSSDNNTEFIEYCNKLARKKKDSVLFVENFDNEYILKTLFAIISNTIDDNCELVSITVE